MKVPTGIGMTGMVVSEDCCDQAAAPAGAQNRLRGRSPGNINPCSEAEMTERRR